MSVEQKDWTRVANGIDLSVASVSEDVTGHVCTIRSSERLWLVMIKTRRSRNSRSVARILFRCSSSAAVRIKAGILFELLLRCVVALREASQASWFRFFQYISVL